MKFKLLILSMLLALSGAVFAADDATHAKDNSTKDAAATHAHDAAASKSTAEDEQVKYQKIIDDFKKYLTTVKKETRDEIVEYRKAIAKINKQKQDLYKKLSKEAQGYLMETQDLKRKLPRKDRKILSDLE